MRRPILVPVLIACSILPARGQQRPLKADSLEVASVRRNASQGFQQAISMQPGGRLVVTNFPVSQLFSSNTWPKPRRQHRTPPSLITALQEQLGLKVEPDRAIMDLLVIDSIDRPTEN
jgi:hypothetical protein